MTKQAATTPAPSLPIEEVARLDALATLGAGAAHSINNALTAALGEAHYLRDERKTDATVVEACDVIVAAVERCARLTQAVALRRGELENGPDGEVDLATQIRSLVGVLGETLGARVDLRSTLAPDLPFVRGSATAIDLMLLSLFHYVAETASGAAQMQLEVSPTAEADAVVIELWVKAGALPDWVADAVKDPSLSGDDPHRTRLEAIALVLAGHGGSRTAVRTAPDAWCARIRLPAAGHEG